MYSDNIQVAAKTETAKGVDAVCAGANVIKVFDAKFTADAKPFKRKPAFPYHGNDINSPGQKTGKLSFKVEMIGGVASAITPPWWGFLLLACKMAQTIGGASVTYAMSADTVNTLTLAYLQDGVMHTLVGCQGNAKVVAQAGEPWYLEFDFSGAYTGYVDQAAFTSGVSLPTTLPNLMESDTVTFGADNPIVSKFELDLGNKVAARKSASLQTGAGAGGILHYYVQDREPKIKVDPEHCLKATADWLDRIESGDTVAVSVVAGTGSAGGIITISVPIAQCQDYKPGNREGALTADVEYQCLPSSGNDELTIVTS